MHYLYFCWVIVWNNSGPTWELNIMWQLKFFSLLTDNRFLHLVLVFHMYIYFLHILKLYIFFPVFYCFTSQVIFIHVSACGCNILTFSVCYYFARIFYYLFTCWWALILILIFSKDKQSCYEHLYTCHLFTWLRDSLGHTNVLEFLRLLCISIFKFLDIVKLALKDHVPINTPNSWHRDRIAYILTNTWNLWQSI